MEILFLFSAILTFLVPSIILFNYLTAHNFRKRSKIYFPLAVIGFLYLVLGIISFLWSSGFLVYVHSDFLNLYSLLFFFQTIFLLKIVYEFNGNKKIFLFLLAYLTYIPIFLISPRILWLLFPISPLIYLVTFTVFFDNPAYKSASYSLVAYAIISLGSFTLGSFYGLWAKLLLPLSALFILPFIFLFTKKIKSFPPVSYLPPRHRESSPIIELLKHFIFIVIITNFIFIGTLSIHELGHLGVSKYYGCENTRIIYDGMGAPHTEANCPNINSSNAILGGVLLPLIIALLLFFGGGKFIKEMAIMIAGFGLVIAYTDFLDLKIPKNLSFFAMLIGIAIVLLGLILLTKSRAGDEYFHLGKKFYD